MTRAQAQRGNGRGRMGRAGQGWIGAALLVLAQALVPGATAGVLDLAGEHGYDAVALRDLDPGSVIDARSAMFRLSNSRNTNPSEEAGCDVGPLRVNAYPVRVYRSPAALLIGGRFDGEVPLGSDWKYTYCNSAAIGIFDSPRIIVERVRARRAWDAVRFSGTSAFFVLEGAWLSQIRDDCVENDFLNDGIVKDVLFDGCFSGISVKQPSSRSEDGTSRTLTVLGALIRVAPYLYRGEARMGPPVKASASSPKLRVIDSVFAMEGDISVSWSQLSASWARISDCRGNLFLWISDAPWPAGVARPPACFRFVQGPEAGILWQRIRENWINCHPEIDRFPDDSASNPGACDRMSHGGQY